LRSIPRSSSSVAGVQRVRAPGRFSSNYFHETMSKIEETIQEFRQAHAKLPEIWTGIDMRAMAFRIDGVWHNALTRCRLVASVVGIPKPKFLPASENVRTFHMVRPVTELDLVLESLAAGELLMDDVPVRFTRRDNHDDSVRPYDFYWFQGLEVRQSPFSRDWVPMSPQPWQGLTLSGAGNSFDEMWHPRRHAESELDEEIHALDAPFDGLDGIAEHVIGMKVDWKNERRAQFTLTAPFEARLNAAKCRLHNGVLEVSVEAESRLVQRHVNVGYVTSCDAGVLVADTRVVEPGEWDGAPGTVSLRLEASAASTSATVLLRLEQRRIERLRLADFSKLGRNPREVAYEFVDSNLDFLRDELGASQRKDAKDFERAFSRLLTLLGFQAIALGPEGKLSDAFDVIAFDPFESSVLAVECTTSSLNSGGKLGKLRMRASELSDELSDHVVQAVIVTTKSNDTLSATELQQAARDRIAVLASDELGELLNWVGAQTALSEIVEYICSKVPEIAPATRG
jgi:hypothetical protein